MTAETHTEKKLAILISGSGTNLQAFIDRMQTNSLGAEIAVVISNRPEVKGLQRAADAGIATETIDHTGFASRELFDEQLIECINRYQCDAVVLAGFMRILTPQFVNHFHGRLFNIHPSLLPKYPGLHTHQRAIDNRDKEAGATVHFVVPELDAGPAIIQASVPIEPGDNAELLAQRVLQKEHIIYPQAVQWFCEDRLQLTNDNVLLDNRALPKTGFLLAE